MIMHERAVAQLSTVTNASLETVMTDIETVMQTDIDAASDLAICCKLEELRAYT